MRVVAIGYGNKRRIVYAINHHPIAAPDVPRNRCQTWGPVWLYALAAALLRNPAQRLPNPFRLPYKLQFQQHWKLTRAIYQTVPLPDRSTRFLLEMTRAMYSIDIHPLAV